MRWLGFLAVLLWPYASFAGSQSWTVSLAGLTLGNFTYASEPNGSVLRTRVANTPMGVFNGVFTASSLRDANGVLRYASLSDTTRKRRKISFRIDTDGQVREVQVSPQDQQTDLSVAARVPVGVIDPVAAFARFTTLQICPGGFLVYDGRRVVQVSLVDTRRKGRHLQCELTYEIIAGPGHLSPLYLNHFRLWLDYQRQQDGSFLLVSMKLRGGVFTLRLQRSAG